MQSNWMNPNWAEENLQTIRTLMERSTLYRRALAPIFIFAGVMGSLAAAAGLIFHLNSPREFGDLWMGTAAVVVVGALFIVRRQAFREHETFWSPPTRRVTQALLPSLVAGMIWGIVISLMGGIIEFLPFIWALFYGCALHSAGFFTSLGVKWFGWVYIGSALVTVVFLTIVQLDVNNHLLMGFFFGVLHLVYGAYLYLTEKRKNTA